MRYLLVFFALGTGCLDAPTFETEVPDGSRDVPTSDDVRGDIKIDTNTSDVDPAPRRLFQQVSRESKPMLIGEDSVQFSSALAPTEMPFVSVSISDNETLSNDQSLLGFDIQMGDDLWMRRTLGGQSSFDIGMQRIILNPDDFEVSRQPISVPEGMPGAGPTLGQGSFALFMHRSSCPNGPSRNISDGHIRYLASGVMDRLTTDCALETVMFHAKSIADAPRFRVQHMTGTMQTDETDKSFGNSIDPTRTSLLYSYRLGINTEPERGAITCGIDMEQIRCRRATAGAAADLSFQVILWDADYARTRHEFIETSTTSTSIPNAAPTDRAFWFFGQQGRNPMGTCRSVVEGFAEKECTMRIESTGGTVNLIRTAANIMSEIDVQRLEAL